MSSFVGSPMWVLDELTTTVSTFVAFAATSHTVFHNVVGAAGGANQVGFHVKELGESSSTVYFLYPLRNGTTQSW